MHEIQETQNAVIYLDLGLLIMIFKITLKAARIYTGHGAFGSVGHTNASELNCLLASTCLLADLKLIDDKTVNFSIFDNVRFVVWCHADDLSISIKYYIHFNSLAAAKCHVPGLSALCKNVQNNYIIQYKSEEGVLEGGETFLHF
jgi:hypothetical protein